MQFVDFLIDCLAIFIFCQDILKVSGFQHSVNEIFALLEIGTLLLIFQDKQSSGVKQSVEDGNYKLSRNIGNKLPIFAA